MVLNEKLEYITTWSEATVNLCASPESPGKRMKRAFRNIAVFLLSTPIIAAIYLLSIFRGKRAAICQFGPIITKAAKGSLRYWVPDISDPSLFDMFKTQMKSNIRRWKPLFDISIAEDSPDTFQIHVKNCPFCEVFAHVGLSDINKYFCKADWEIANDNRGKWVFTRTRTIESGDRFCDHTYRRHGSLNQAIQPTG